MAPGGEAAPLGHAFDSDSDEMLCPCGMSWHDHQELPTVCPGSRSRYELKPREGQSPLDGLRRLMGVSMSTIANEAGVSRQTAQRALAGNVGGRRATAPATAERVHQAVRDLAGED